MARLLIADDELYTLDGILQCIDFTRLGISEVQTAADGLAAIRLLDTYQPDILLTDVRMPHADGIALSKHIRENLPSCQIVFMSGYSDTAYLKAAIELKALNYIEKPFLLSELYEALEKAVSAHQEYQLLHEKNLAFHTALTHLRSAFLNTLIDQPIFQEPSPEKIAALGSTLRPSSFLQTAILKLDVYQVEKIYGRGGLRHILTQLETTLTARNLPVFFSIHSPGEILLLVFDSEGAQKAQTYLKAVCEEIPRALHGFDFFLIGIGSLEQGLQQVRHSYEAAQVSLEFGFYGKHGSVVNAKGASTRPVLEPHLPDLQAYMRLIQSGKKEESILSLKSYTENLYMQPIFPVQKVRHFYLRVIFQLEQLSTFNEKKESFLQQVESALYLQDMAAAAMQQLSQYWESSSSMVPYSASVRSIMDFISIHYMEPDLCIESISRHVLLSVSYVCSIFKSETKQTVNQYLTAYRIQKAKQLLQDSRYRVVDIMLRVGFNNANYFSKVFRKLEGCTPSEYREKYTK